MAENLHNLGINITMIEAQNQVMSPLDFDMAQLVHQNMNTNGVELILSDAVKSFEKKDNDITVLLNSGRKVSVDIVILSIGVRPNSELAKAAGIELNEKGGIKVNTRMQTSAPSVWAVGDVIEVVNLVLDKPAMIPLAGPANKQARVLANNLVGIDDEYEGSLGTSVAKVFDYTVASVGINEKTLVSMGKVRNKDYHIALINQKSHAGYYPGATQITLKMLFSPEGKIFGAQIIGQDGVDKRIDTIATTMRLDGTTGALAKLELAYAPPYSSAKDPVNMLGFVAENIIRKTIDFIQCDEIKKDDYFLDIREAEELNVWEFPNANHIPLGELRNRIDELPKDKRIVVLCAVGVRAYNASCALRQRGFEQVSVLAGGTMFYKSVNFVPKPIIFNDKAVIEESVSSMDKEYKILDCNGLQCPGPIMKTNESLKNMKDGELLRVSATDMGFGNDVENWCQKTGNTFISKDRQGNENIVLIRKGTDVKAAETVKSNTQNGKSMVVFDGDLDKAIAAFIIANGAASMGRPVTMFFTFWGLNILRKPEKQKVKKSFIENMFGGMMPRGVNKLKLSNMNMLGMGSKMMKSIMKAKNVTSLEELIKSAMASGVRIIACTMSMDVMGIREEELIDGVEFAGVATYLASAEESDVNLFI
jgi:peroxiredoxin family protein/TusA-related sulfurtransferase/rhodanese-related sulfurtransferase